MSHCIYIFLNVSYVCHIVLPKVLIISCSLQAKVYVSLYLFLSLSYYLYHIVSVKPNVRITCSLIYKLRHYYHPICASMYLHPKCISFCFVTNMVALGTYRWWGPLSNKKCRDDFIRLKYQQQYQ